MNNYVVANFERKLNKEPTVQECDARVMIREQMPGTKKLRSINYREVRN